MRLPPKALLELLATWLDENLYLSYVPLETVMSTAQTFVPGLISWIVLTNSKDETDAAVANKLHLALLKIILKAPQGIVQVREIDAKITKFLVIKGRKIMDACEDRIPSRQAEAI